MNTFNFKQWLTENRVGPYRKTQINESHEGNDAWLDAFADAVDALKVDKFIKHQIHQIPSHQVVSMYGETTPERAAAEIVSKMSHSAREGRVSEGSEVGGSEMIHDFEIELEDGQEYLVTMYVDWRAQYDSYDYEYGDVDFDVEIKELSKGSGDTYIPVNDPNEIKQVKQMLETDPKLGKSIINQIDFSSGEEPFDEPERFDDDMYEQMGVGYVMKVKKSDPHDR